MARIQSAWRRALFLLRGGDRLRGSDDEHTARGFHLLLTVFLIWVGIMELVVVPLFAVHKAAGVGLGLILGGAALAALVLLRRGRKRAAAALFLSVLWCVSGGLSLLGGGLSSGVTAVNVVIILCAGWLLGRSPALGFAAATVALSSIEAILEQAGHLPPRYFSRAPLVIWGFQVLIVVLAVGPMLAILETLRQQFSTLRESEERFRSLSNAALEGIMIHDRGVVLDANLAFARLFGYERPEELIGKDAPELLLTPESRALIRQRMERRGTELMEVTGVRRNGATFTGETESQPVKYLGHDASLVACRDITERKRAAEALRESEERYKALFDRSLDCVFITDFEGHFLDANQPALNLLGYRREDIATLTFASLLTEDQLPLAYHGAAEVLAAGYQQNPTEFRLRCRDGGVVFVETQSSLIYRDGQPFAVQGIARDITARKRAEEEKARLQEQLHQAQKMESIGRLAGGVAHDFNNLLTVINGFSQLLLNKLSAGDPLRASLVEIHKAGERAAALTRQLLAFSRKQVLQPRVLDLNRVIEEMRPMLPRLLGEDVEVRIALHAESAMVDADPHQLEQVIMNLVVNARDAMPHGGRLSIETAVVEWGESHAQSHPGVRAGRCVMLAVSDSGIGMDEATRQRIFEPFFTTKEAGKGTGLGLSMVQGSVEQSGGCIEVHSEPGRGTTFSIYLPAPPGAAADAGMPPAPPALSGKETILVVEDQEEVRKYAAAALRSYGYRVVQAANAEEALRVCQREPIHLVLTDVVMPDMSGRELAYRLGKRWPAIKVLFMSGYTDDAIVHQVVLEKGAEFIQKPFSPEELAIKVRELLVAPVSGAGVSPEFSG
jgi:PAS domain S-box-containing protein